MAFVAGPILYALGADAERTRLTALVVTDNPSPPGSLAPAGAGAVLPELLAECAGGRFWRYVFTLPARADASYVLEGEEYGVAAALSGDVRIAYVSCNGQEHGDAQRDNAERNVLWRMLHERHDKRPYHLLLHGGDQLYADEAKYAHPELKRWAGLPMQKKGEAPFTAEMRDAVERYFFERYRDLNTAPSVAHLCARVPSLMMWDDHDIMDGWGSHYLEMLESPCARGIFEVARRMFALWQLGCNLDERSPICVNGSSPHFSWQARFPEFSIIAPDLRSTRKPDQVMSEDSWEHFIRVLNETPDGEPVVLMSSVPALGPRLSLVESFLRYLPGLQKYEDDLRDQWQSRAHRVEWRRLLSLLEERRERHGNSITIVSGEIHMATRGTMRCGNGGVLHQLVSSGITHTPPPSIFARVLGLLASFGEDPLKGRPIELHPLPGAKRIYTIERNALELRREGGLWNAAWLREHSGETPALQLT